MKQTLLLGTFLLIAGFCVAQEKTVSMLPAGKYETVVKNSQYKWDRGDIILLDNHQYRVSTSNEVGEYKFSSVAQRIFFTSGPLKNLYAKTALNNEAPVIVLPAEENAQAGVRAEVWCYHKQ